MADTLVFVIANWVFLMTISFIVTFFEDIDADGFWAFVFSFLSMPISIFLLRYSDIAESTIQYYIYAIIAIALLNLVLAAYKIIYMIMCDYKDPEDVSKLLKKYTFSSVAVIVSYSAALIMGISESIPLVSASIGGIVFVSVSLFGP